MKKALVPACGNSQRGDDGVALQVVSYLQNDLCHPATEFQSQPQWTPELAEPISQRRS
jgi:Ni,Fe-hydrogenase maturation factor